MADKPGYPQIPNRVWWGLRALLLKSPKIKLDEPTLAAELQVQPAASRQYLSEFRRVGLLTEEGAATELALSWRMDESYRDAANKILSQMYPEQLVHVAPAGGADRNKVEKWFMNQGLGEGTAKNKAATYVMIANDEPPAGNDGRTSARSMTSPRQPKKSIEVRPTDSSKASSQATNGARPELMPLNVNVQIHISSEASAEQIEAIFVAMRKHLYEGLSH